MDQGKVNCLRLEPCGSKWDIHVWEDSFLGPAPLDSCFSVSRGSDERRQSVEGQSLYVLDVLLPGLAINRLSMLLYKTIEQNYCFLTFFNNGT